MSKKQDSPFQGDSFSSRSPQGAGVHQSDNWQIQLAQVAKRFNRQYQGGAFELPEEVEAMPIFREWAAGTLTAKIASPFWEIAQPQKNQRCLDKGSRRQLFGLSLAGLVGIFLWARNQHCGTGCAQCPWSPAQLEAIQRCRVGTSSPLEILGRPV